jgi:adenosylmethionine-8-amino-7-oxononanoate aminotransferase
MSKEFDASTLKRMDRDHFIHPYTDFSSFHREGSKVISDASGVHVKDAEGNQYLDAMAGLWCVNIGHGNREMADAIYAQTLKMEFYNPFGHTTNEPAAILSEKLAEITPDNINHVFFTTGGSTANDTAVRLAHYYHEMRGLPNKRKIISRVDAYHGSTYFAAGLTGIQGTKTGFNQIAEDMIHYVSAANMYRRPENMDEAKYCDHLIREFEDRLLQLDPDTVAAFIAEPIMGAGGVLVAPAGYHKAMSEVCQRHDVLYIADEVVTAFGRLGRMFSSEELFGYKPDIIVVAKGITSGYIPMGATLISDEIYDAISRPQCEGGTLTLGFTYSGHAVACAAALKSIEIIEKENLCEHVRTVGPYFMQQLGKLAELPIVGDVRGSHLMAAVELVANKDSRRSFDVGLGATGRVFDRCLDHGVMVRPVGNVLVLSPPLILTEEHCDVIVAALGSSLGEVAAEPDIAKACSA